MVVSPPTTLMRSSCTFSPVVPTATRIPSLAKPSAWRCPGSAWAAPGAPGAGTTTTPPVMVLSARRLPAGETAAAMEPVGAPGSA